MVVGTSISNGVVCAQAIGIAIERLYSTTERAKHAGGN